MVEQVKATVEVRLLERFAGAVEEAVVPEIRWGSSRIRADVKRFKGGLTLELEATRLPDMRAALNSYLRLIKVSEETAKISSGFR